NVDGIVDMNDYNFWKASFGSTTSLAADGNHDGVIDAADYSVWRDHFSSSGAASAAVPEPAAGAIAAEAGLTLLLIALVPSLGRRCPRQDCPS
ncbi:MAG TPA: hypothetical protein VGM76_15560, partial [Lacipirellulaceae bacterium]